MRHVNHARLLATVCFVTVLTLSLGSCEEDAGVQVPSLVGPTGDGYDPVFNADGGFVITYGMLDKQYNEITFPGTHNSAANHTTEACENQGLGIWQQMVDGIRYIELDVNDALWTCHSGWCSFHDINYHFDRFKTFVRNHPHQVITVRITDLCTGLGAWESYERINGRLEDTGLDAYVYNWDPTKPKSDPGRCYIPDPWPTLREMIESGKNVMFFHNRNCGEHAIFDEGLYQSLDYANDDLFIFWQAIDLQDLCKLTSRWAPPRERQREGSHRLFLAECEPDNHDDAGDRRFASRNNDGRKLYQLAKYQETDILPDGRAVNVIIVDYFGYTTTGFLPINVVDACNRLNFERFGIDWENSEAFWELYPYEFDDSKVEHITRVPALKAEVEEVILDFNNKVGLDGHERKGQVVSTSYQAEGPDWKRLPEWAVDDDFFTRWCGANNNPNHAWGIDLGEPKAIDEIAIAWEYPHHRPGYRVYASNDDSKFADGISQAELADDSGWTFVAEGARVAGGTDLLWDQKHFQNTGTSAWRYVKVKVTDTGEYEWPTFYELRLFGPAD